MTDKDGTHTATPAADGSLVQKPSSEAMDGGHWAALASGRVVFLGVYFMGPLAPAVDPAENSFPLTREGKAALALSLLAAIWWVLNPPDPYRRDGHCHRRLPSAV